MVVRGFLYTDETAPLGRSSKARSRLFCVVAGERAAHSPSKIINVLLCRAATSFGSCWWPSPRWRVTIASSTTAMAGRSATCLDEISRHYYEPVDNNSLFQGAVEGMVDRLKDDYSEYIPPPSKRRSTPKINKRFEGVGMEVALDPKTKQLVVTPLAGSPAYAAGVRAGDAILAIDGRGAQGMSLDEVVKLIQGAPGTSVALSILHEGQQKPVRIEVVRRMIEVGTVHGDRRNADGSWDFFLPGHDRIGYVRISGFGEKTADDLREAMDWLTAHQMRALILDLRDNPGGLLTSAAEVCDMFIDSGRDRHDERPRGADSRGVRRQRQRPVHRVSHGRARQPEQRQRQRDRRRLPPRPQPGDDRRPADLRQGDGAGGERPGRRSGRVEADRGQLLAAEQQEHSSAARGRRERRLGRPAQRRLRRRRRGR